MLKRIEKILEMWKMPKRLYSQYLDKTQSSWDDGIGIDSEGEATVGLCRNCYRTQELANKFSIQEAGE
jgi:hypothetical protein